MGTNLYLMIKLLKSTFVDAMRVLCVAFFALTLLFTIIQFVTGKSPYSLARDLYTQRTSAAQTEPCNSRSPLNLNGVRSAELQKLTSYQQACKSYVAGTMMTFIGIPTSNQDANDEAKAVASTLKDFSAHHVQPLVMAEARDYTTNKLVDMGKFAAGGYTSNLATMFADLKSAGVTRSQMGIWNPFPEANMPQWSNSQPQYFAPSVNTYVNALEQAYPGTQTSIMLSSATYLPSDTSLKNGQYISLLPYLTGITSRTITYVGMEGFPWLPPRGQAGTMLDASIFLKPSLASEAADYLGTKNIWLNTGTFSAMYTQEPTHTASLSPDQRQIILSGIDQQALSLQHQGYHVAINIFAQDKSNTSEETDWSYLGGSNSSASDNTIVLTDFVRTLGNQHIDFWLFDQ